MTRLWYAFFISVLLLVYGSRRPPRRGGGGNHGQWLGIAPSADGARDDWGVSSAAAGGYFAGCGQRVFRAVRGATKGSAFGNRDLGCSPSVGKSGRREIFRQDKMRVRSHTVCMARNRSAVLAENIRRAPQTHGRWTALIRKKSSKTFIFGICKLSPLLYWGISLESTSVKYSGSSQRTVTGSSVRGCRNVNSRAWRHWLSIPNSGFLWP